MSDDSRTEASPLGATLPSGDEAEAETSFAPGTVIGGRYRIEACVAQGRSTAPRTPSSAGGWP